MDLNEVSDDDDDDKDAELEGDRASTSQIADEIFDNVTTSEKPTEQHYYIWG